MSSSKSSWENCDGDTFNSAAAARTGAVKIRFQADYEDVPRSVKRVSLIDFQRAPELSLFRPVEGFHGDPIDPIIS